MLQTDILGYFNVMLVYMMSAAGSHVRIFSNITRYSDG